MPELPEVETIVRGLRRAIVGKTLRDFLVFDKKILQPKLSFPQKITGVARHGKYIVLETDKNFRFVVHLRMTGELLLGQQNKNSERRAHERARFIFSGGRNLHLIDQRRFGTVEWLKAGRPLPVLGPDPLSPGFTAKVFYRILQNSSRAIKSLLLDQKKIAGIGNIYADESLWMARIHTERKSDLITQKEVGRLQKAIRDVLRQAIKKGGFTLRDYRRVDGRLGEYQNYRKVYDREGERCLRCRSKIKRMKIGGRSAHFCPSCQKEPISKIPRAAI